jgi:hypothetical protein
MSWLPSIPSRVYIYIYGGTQKIKVPLLNNYGSMPLKDEFGSLQMFSTERMPSDRNLT